MGTKRFSQFVAGEISYPHLPDRATKPLGLPDFVERVLGCEVLNVKRLGTNQYTVFFSVPGGRLHLSTETALKALKRRVLVDAIQYAFGCFWLAFDDGTQVHAEMLFRVPQ